MQTSSTSIKKSKKATSQPQAIQLQKQKSLKSTRPNVQDIYPVQITNVQNLSTQLKNYVNDLQREYIEKHNILISNRRKYQQIIQNLGIMLDEKGVSSHLIAQVLKNGTYHQSFE